MVADLGLARCPLARQIAAKVEAVLWSCGVEDGVPYFALREVILSLLPDTSFFWLPEFYCLAASLICGRLFTKGEGSTLGLAHFTPPLTLGWKTQSDQL